MRLTKSLRVMSPWLVFVVVIAVPNCYSQHECASYLPPGKGKELLKSLCTSCHDLTWTVTSRKDSEGWRRSVNSMLAASDPQFAQYLGDEIDILTRYLAEYFGPLIPTCETLQKDAELRGKYLAGKIRSLIDINSASLTDLMRLPGITKDSAGLIIKYRETHGPFKAKEELKAVSGITDTECEKLKGLITLD